MKSAAPRRPICGRIRAKWTTERRGSGPEKRNCASPSPSDRADEPFLKVQARPAATRSPAAARQRYDGEELGRDALRAAPGGGVPARA